MWIKDWSRPLKLMILNNLRKNDDRQRIWRDGKGENGNFLLPGKDEEDDGTSSGAASSNKAFTKAETPGNAV